LEVVSRDVGLTSKLIYDVVMHTAPDGHRHYTHTGHKYPTTPYILPCI